MSSSSPYLSARSPARCHRRRTEALSGVLLAVLLVATADATAVAAVASAQEPAAAGNSAQRVAVIDVQRLLTESKAGRRVLERLGELKETKETELDRMSEELQSLRQEISDGQLSLSQELLAEKQTRLEDGLIDFERAQADADRELQEQRSREFEAIEQAIMPIIEQVGGEGGYSLIFNKFQSGLLFAEEAIDITVDVLTRLDAGGGPTPTPAE